MTKAIIPLVLLLAFVGGCPPHLDPAHAAAADKSHQDAEVKAQAIADQAKVKAAADAAAAKAAADAAKAKADQDAAAAKAHPAVHPLAQSSETILNLQKGFGPIFFLSFLAAAAFFGMYWTPFSLVSKIGAPIAISIAVASLLGIVALPFVPIAFIVVVVALIGLFVYEIIRTKSVKGGIDAVETDIGIKTTTSTTVTSPEPSSVTVTPPTVTVTPPAK